MNKSFIYPDNWQHHAWHCRIEFYGSKWEAYQARYPGQWPSRRTVQRWVKEFSEQVKEHNEKLEEVQQ